MTSRGLATDILVGESILLGVQAGGAELVFSLCVKSPHPGLRGVVDRAQITLTIEPKHGQRARVRVQASESVRIGKPDKLTA